MGQTGCNPTGVKARASAIQIKFRLKGETEYCYETLPWSPTPANIIKAGKLRNDIVTKIKHDAFSYGDFFPDSIRAQHAQGTFFQYCQAWLDCPTKNWTKDSRDKFKGILEGVWMPNLHGKQIRTIQRSHLIEALAAAIVRFKTNYNKEPSESVYNNWLLCIRGVFNTAVTAGAIKRLEDPTQDLQNKTRIKTDVDPFDIEEANAIIDAAYINAGEMWGAWFELGFYSGMRYPSEPSALTWADVDLRKGEVRISKIMTKAGLQLSTKTKKSRILFLNSRSRSALARLKPVTYSLCREIFLNEAGGSTYKAAVQRNIWREILESLGIRYRDMYNMRHTYATFGLMNGVNPAFMASQLGHSIEEFFKTYAKWINNQQNEVQLGVIERAISLQSGAKSGQEFLKSA